MDEYTRREFLRFMGQGAAFSSIPLELWAHERKSTARLSVSPTLPSTLDAVVLKEGLSHSILLSYGQIINRAGEKFGSDNDFTAFIPLSKTEALLWVNHETPDAIDRIQGKADLQTQMLSVGGSIVKLQYWEDEWRFVSNDPMNRRLNGLTEIPFAPRTTIRGKESAMGTLANCSGGMTPWGNILSCEENYQHYYGDRDAKGKAIAESQYGWDKTYPNPPEHYGWVVEVNPRTGSAKKLVALGRYCREGATVVKAQDGRCVVYSGDDSKDCCVYKFVADKSGSLETGKLYVADGVRGKWLLLDWHRDARLKAHFSTPLEMLIFAREAAKVVGGTPYPRPEGIAFDTKKGAAYVSLTGTKGEKNDFGAILKIQEKGGDPLSLEFEASTFLAGGKGTGFVAPDNIVFGPDGNLWMTTDLSGPNPALKNNGLFCIPLQGSRAGEAIQVGSAPVDAEFTGPSFSADGKTLILSVQHPGENSRDVKTLSSRWPNGKGVPLSSVIAIKGVDKLLS